MVLSFKLLHSPLFASDYHELEWNASAKRSYQRAKAIGVYHGKWCSPFSEPTYNTIVTGLTHNDISSTSTKFWDSHRDAINCIDGAATTLLTIQYNLVVGSLGQANPTIHMDSGTISELIESLLAFKVL